jgi:multicomponent Na+:H+ antiporter subunit D
MLLPPAIIMIIGGLLLPFVHKNARSTVVVLIPLATLFFVWQSVEHVNGAWQPVYNNLVYHIAGFNLLPFVLHDYTLIFATVFCLAAFSGGVFALPQMRKDGPLELSAAYVYAGSAIGVTFSGDFISLFLYWELMAVASTMVVLCGRTKAATRAALRYAYMHFFGGVVLLIGIIGYATHAGTFVISPLEFDVADLLNFAELSSEKIFVGIMLIGVLVNAAAPPFSAWLADAYPEASPSGAVFLSAFTTKTAVFVLLTIFVGSDVLIYLGLFMVFYGIIYAMLENNMRRILSYSIINQVGFMVTGVGIGTELAQLGVAAHAFCHIIYKALLLMSAGSVIFMTGKHRCTDVGGLWHSMKFTAVCGIIGALAISAFPWTSGFVSKSMISSAAAYEHMSWVWFLLAAASAGVFLHAGIKFPWFVFFQKDSGLRPAEPPQEMRWAMLFLSFMCILPGLFPEHLYSLLPVEVTYEPYTVTHVVTQLQLLLWAGLAFFLALPWLKRTNTISLDMDWIYRVMIKNFLLVLERGIVNSFGGLKSWGIYVLEQMHGRVIMIYGPSGILARTWTLHTTVTLAGTMLVLLLAIYYLS